VITTPNPAPAQSTLVASHTQSSQAYVDQFQWVRPPKPEIITKVDTDRGCVLPPGSAHSKLVSTRLNYSYW